jgi:hypothetical protein
MFKIRTHFLYLLDATKAFDRLHHCKLFKLLIKRELQVCIVRPVRVFVNLCINQLILLNRSHTSAISWFRN